MLPDSGFGAVDGGLDGGGSGGGSDGVVVLDLIGSDLERDPTGAGYISAGRGGGQ